MDTVQTFNKYIFYGTHSQIGLQYGEQLREEIHFHLDIILDLACKHTGLGREAVLQSALGFEPYIKKYAPGFCEEIKGISCASGISYAEAILLQVRQEVIYTNTYGGPECTSYVVGGSYTDKGQIYIGQNLDLNGPFEKISNIVEIRAEGKPAVMMVLPAGQISNTGLNNLGLGINCNFLSCMGWQKGFPRYLISRLGLECSTAAEAAALIKTIAERSSSRNFLIADAGGNFVDLEVTPMAIATISTGEEMFVHSNHFLSDDMLQYDCSRMPDAAISYTDSLWRYSRLKALMESNHGHINSDMIKSFLRDHDKGPDDVSSICMHQCEKNKNYRTVASMISNLTELTFEVACGQPCSSSYTKYHF